MSPDEQLAAAALVGVGVAIAAIVWIKLPPFLGLLLGAMIVGSLAGKPPSVTLDAIGKGVGDILGSTGLVVALGLSLGAMLTVSGAAETLARAAIAPAGPRAAPWVSLALAMLIGLPLFFETGVVLILPVVAAAATADRWDGVRATVRLKLLLSAAAGLSVVHALVPPHPGPLLAVDTLHAELGRTMIYGIAVAIPTAALAGPLLARLTTRHVTFADAAPTLAKPSPTEGRPPLLTAVICVLLPVALIAAGQVIGIESSSASASGIAATIGNPVLALVLANLVALILLFGRRYSVPELRERIWGDAMKPAGALLLSIGAGGALKQVLVSAGIGGVLAHAAAAHAVPPLLLAWAIAAAIRVATGSATVATVTTVGLVASMTAATGVEPEWLVLAIGAGSVFLSHVNDPGFWLVRGYLGISTADTFRTWSVLEVVISMVGLAVISAAAHVI